MITSPLFRDRKYAILGLARSGLATLETLAASGADLVAWDNRAEARAAAEGKAKIVDPMETELAGLDGVVLSPGIPLNRHPIAAKARAANVPLICDIELFTMARETLPRHRVVGITGTNGKSTTTALVHHLLDQAGVPARMGGNIGLPILSQQPLPEGGVYVLELSSYQIDLTRTLDCDVAVLLNISPDHLDRYASYEAYARAKARLFEMQEGGIAIVASDDAESREILGRIEKRRSAERIQPADAIAIGDQSDWPALQGPHNFQNARAASATCRALGLSDEQIDAGLRSFAGLPHRMERVGEYNGVLYVNDSKATNPASTAPALAAFPRIHWIVGGLPKEDGLDECAPNFGNVVKAYTIGDAGPRFAELLGPHMPVDESEMLCTAIRRAVREAKPGDTVLLSPACASFDQFRDFEARGDCFRKAVNIYAAQVAETCNG